MQLQSEAAYGGGGKGGTPLEKFGAREERAGT